MCSGCLPILQRIINHANEAVYAECNSMLACSVRLCCEDHGHMTCNLPSTPWLSGRIDFAHSEAYAAGSRYSPATAGQPKGCPFCSIACVFNHRRVYANLQPSSSMAAAAFVFEDVAQWRELVVHAQDIPGPHGTRFDLQVSFATAASTVCFGTYGLAWSGHQ